MTRRLHQATLPTEQDNGLNVEAARAAINALLHVSMAATEEAATFATNKQDYLEQAMVDSRLVERMLRLALRYLPDTQPIQSSRDWVPQEVTPIQSPTSQDHKL